MSSIFTDMAEACIDALEPAERQQIPAPLFIKLVRTCSDIAERALCANTISVDGLPRPPATQPIRAGLLTAGDFVWRSDFSFDVIDAVSTDSGEVAVLYTDGHIDLHPADHLKRVAVCRTQADDWNLHRVLMDADSLRQLAALYGTYTD